jgi:hypothetical protein
VCLFFVCHICILSHLGLDHRSMDHVISSCSPHSRTHPPCHWVGKVNRDSHIHNQCVRVTPHIRSGVSTREQIQ